MGAESWTSGVLVAAAMKDGLDRPDGLIRYFGTKSALLRNQSGKSCASGALARGLHGRNAPTGSRAPGRAGTAAVEQLLAPIPVEGIALLLAS